MTPLQLNTHDVMFAKCRLGTAISAGNARLAGTRCISTAGGGATAVDASRVPTVGIIMIVVQVGLPRESLTALQANL